MMKPVFRGLLLVAAMPIQAGPPFRTDDPEPVEPGHMELYLFGSGQRQEAGSSGLGPALEFNYGVFADTQFHLILPIAQNRPEGQAARAGYGDTELGIKYRFVHETELLPQVGVFPLVELPTGKAEAGLGAGHTQVFLPVWLQKGWGAWTTYGGGGWWRNPGEGQRNWTYAGWLLQRTFSDWATLGGEFYRTSPMEQGGQDSTGFTLGGILNFGEGHHLLLSLGRNTSGDRERHAYLGYQLTLGPAELRGIPGFRAAR